MEARAPTCALVTWVPVATNVVVYSVGHFPWCSEVIQSLRDYYCSSNFTIYIYGGIW